MTKTAIVGDICIRVLRNHQHRWKRERKKSHMEVETHVLCHWFTQDIHLSQFLDSLKKWSFTPCREYYFSVSEVGVQFSVNQC